MWILKLGTEKHGIRTLKKEIVLADEISPDTCRLWIKTEKKLDKDRFRKDWETLSKLIRGKTKFGIVWKTNISEDNFDKTI